VAGYGSCTYAIQHHVILEVEERNNEAETGALLRLLLNQAETLLLQRGSNTAGNSIKSKEKPNNCSRKGPVNLKFRLIIRCIDSKIQGTVFYFRNRITGNTFNRNELFWV
jgi:hypothetical protein